MQNVKLSYWNFYVTLIGVSLWCVCLYSNAATDNTSEYIYSILSVSVPNLLILLCFFFSFHFKPNSFDANTTQCYLTFASFHDVETVNLVRLCKLKGASQYWILRTEYWVLSVCCFIGLAALVTHYVYRAINTPDVVPNVQVAWDLFVKDKCSDTIKKCQQKYNELMDLKLPCDNAEIHLCHESAMEETKDLFMAEMSGISTTTVEKQLRELKVTPLSSS